MQNTGIIFDLKKFAIHDGPGIRTTVFFKGCPLNCAWCHNPESRSEGIEQLKVCTPRSSRPNANLGREVSADELMADIMQDQIFYDQSGGGVTFSGGEPMLQIDFLITMLERCRAAGIRTAVDTSGFAPWAGFKKIVGLADLILYDLKLIDDIEHIKYIGLSNVLILSNLEQLATTGMDIRIRIPLIPGITDTETNLDAVASFLDPLAGVRKISLLPYNKLGEDKRRRYQLGGDVELQTQDDATLTKKRHHLEQFGFQVTVGG